VRKDSARRVVRLSSQRVRGRLPSTKNKLLNEWESQHERHAAYWFEFCPEIVEFASQPISIGLPLDGRVTTYTPDFKVIWESGEHWIVEIKEANDLLDPNLRRKLDAASAYFDELGYQFFVITEVELSQSALIHNLNLLRPYKRLTIQHSLIDSVERLIADNGKCTLFTLCEFVQSRQTTLALLAKGICSFDLFTPITSETTIKISKGDHYATMHARTRSAPDFGFETIPDCENTPWKYLSVRKHRRLFLKDLYPTRTS
jgi:hypothetical protein